ncbi:MAG: DUF2336 domain-containing protein [Maricaulaceae bacterium]
MSTSPNTLNQLVDLASERSSEKRRDLLRELSGLFLESEEINTHGASREIADDIFVSLLSEVEASARAELAERFADHPNAPVELVNELARDMIEVARPILERSVVVRDETLIDSIRKHGGEHAAAIAGRETVSEKVSTAVSRTGDDRALVTLAKNEGARLSREAMENLVDRAESCSELHEPLVEREELAPDLLNEMFFVVQDKLRNRILERTESISREELEAAFAAAQDRLARKTGPKPRDYDDAVRYVSAKKLRKALTHELLSELLLQGEKTKFVVAFAELTGLSFAAARRTIDNPEVEPLAIACRSAEFSRDDFVRIAMLRPTASEREEADADALGQIYEALPVAAAERVMRFVKLRDQSSDAA